MPEIDPVTLKLFVDNGKAVAELNRYGRVADQQFSLVQRGAGTAERAIGRLSGVLAGVSVAALAKSFLDIADTAKSLDAQLRLATAGFGSFAQAQEDVRRVAAQTRSDLTDTGTLYGSFARTAKEIGASQMEAAQGTETFSKALKIGGAGTAQVQSATLQLGQALASTNVQWEELGQILEASPRLAKVFTDSLGVTRQQLKQMASDGKLSGEQLFNALNDKKITKGIDAEFAQLPVTFEQAMTQVSNAATITFGAFDRGGQFSTALANFITQGTDGFADLETSAAQSGVEIRAAFEGLANAFEPMLQGALAAFGQIDGRALSLRDSIASLLGSIDTVRNFLPDIGNKAKAFDNKYLGTSYQMQPRSDLKGAFTKGFDEASLRGQRAAGLTPASRILGRLSDANQGARSTTPRPAPAAAKPSGGKKSGGGANSAEAAARKAENERIKAIRDDASKAREAAQLQDDINAAKAALAVAANDVLAFNLADIESQRSQRVAEFAAQAKLGKLTDKELADRTAAVNEIADLQRRRVQQIADEANRRDELDVAQSANQNQQDLYRAQADLTSSREERYAIELRLVQLAYDQEKAELEGVLASQTATQAQKDIAAARLAILGQLQNSAERQVDRQNEGPLARYRRDLDSPDRRNDQVESAVIDELEGVRDSISSAVQKTLGIKNPILAALIDSFIEQQLIKPLLAGVSGAGGGEGGFLTQLIAGAKTFFGGARANGGPVSTGKAYLVGERGPELFRPSGSGAIVPNNQLVGAAARGMANASAVRASQNTIINQTFTLDARGGITTPELLQYVNTTAQREGRKAGGGAFAASQQSTPGTLNKYTQLKG